MAAYLMPTKDPRYISGPYKEIPMWDGLECADNPHANAVYEGAMLGTFLTKPETALLERARARNIDPATVRAAWQVVTEELQD